MRVPKAEVERRGARFEEAAKQGGAELTHQRLAIFREVAVSTNSRRVP